MTFGVYTIATESISSTPTTAHADPPVVVVLGREYRTWLSFPEGFTDIDLPLVDFIVAHAAAPTNNAAVPLPIGSLTRSRFYYGNTAAGIVEADDDPTFRPLWLYPVSVALAATPWARWGAGNRWFNGPVAVGDNAAYGFADDTAQPHTYWTPAIGLKGEGTTIIGMQLNDVTALNLPFPTKIDRWFFHYSEVGNVPQNDTIDDIAGGPMNPYMLVAHQGRVVFPDRRRSAGGIATTSGGIDHGSIDDILFYSDYLLPTQSPLVTALGSDGGVSNAAYGEFGTASMQPYNSQLVAEDVPSGFGTIGVVTIDQILLVRHRGGGALISGDLDQPTHHRLPYVESTGGVICKGMHTPIGFVYGSVNGIFTWQGGDTTQRISPQLDGFFWDHTDGGDAEVYAGSRGSMALWNGFVCVPNNYLFDIDGQSWWRLETATLAPVSDETAAFNCYDVDEDQLLYAFGYRHIADGDDAPPVWHTFDRNVLDDSYSWQSHPLVETRGRVVSFQNVQLLVEGTSDDNTDTAPTVTVTLAGFDETGTSLTSVTTTLTLAASREPQLLRADLLPNFTASYVTVGLHSLDPNGNPAPTIRLVRLGTKQRATTVRHG